MAGSNVRTKELVLDEKWDHCLDLALHRTVYGSLAGITSALLLFRSPFTKLASIAFGAGLGLGSAYTDCSHIFDGQIPKWTGSSSSSKPPPRKSNAPVSD
eukprot:TRINITY_DN10890_c0_g4_i2.p2 TRINITY_DN10890_c0_g4~~TRINITY_DN10890_c0_g4_i2.p2  ORF type:complete len:100 (-),score=7.92 TRINITY_DN10890_c0_g4_i2:323-622(-)